METGKELFNEEEAWYEAWGYAGAVDGETDTAFRSPDGEYPCRATNAQNSLLTLGTIPLDSDQSG